MMRRIKISLPATITDLGPALGGLGLALGLRTVIEITERSDDSLHVETTGEDAGRYSIGLRHPVLLGLIRVFQRLETTVLGLNIHINNQIPHAAGLGIESIYLVAGIVGANNLLGTPFSREQTLHMCAQETRRPDQAAATILGGLTTAILDEDSLVYRNLAVAALQLVIVAPDADRYAAAGRGMLPDRVLLRDAVANLSRTPLLLEALREGDLKLLSTVANDRLLAPHTHPLIPGLESAINNARAAGAHAIVVTRSGALVAFVSAQHKEVASTIETSLQNAGTSSRAWILPIDRQGIVISVAQSS